MIADASVSGGVRHFGDQIVGRGDASLSDQVAEVIGHSDQRDETFVGAVSSDEQAIAPGAELVTIAVRDAKDFTDGSQGQRKTQYSDQIDGAADGHHVIEEARGEISDAGSHCGDTGGGEVPGGEAADAAMLGARHPASRFATYDCPPAPAARASCRWDSPARGGVGFTSARPSRMTSWTT